MKMDSFQKSGRENYLSSLTLSLWNPNSGFEHFEEENFLSFFLETHKNNNKAKRKGYGYLNSPPIFKGGDVSAYCCFYLYLKAGSVLSTAFIDLLLFFFPRLRCVISAPSGLSEGGSESALLNFWMSPFLRQNMSTNLSLPHGFPLSVNSGKVFSVDYHFIHDSGISELGTGTRLKSLICQTKIQF